MLTDPKEIEIISKAIQPNIRKKERSRDAFFHIFQDFFRDVPLTGHYIDMGPGHFDFGELIREKGGDCFGIDNDPAVVELGRYKGFEVAEIDIKSLARKPLNREFDGVFNKFTFNAFWSWNKDERHHALVQAIVDMMKDDAWSWIAPWNGVPKDEPIGEAEIARTLELQREFFEDNGFETHILTIIQAGRYGITGRVANNVIFTKNLKWEPRGA